MGKQPVETLEEQPAEERPSRKRRREKPVDARGVGAEVDMLKLILEAIEDAIDVLGEIRDGLDMIADIRGLNEAQEEVGEAPE